MKTIIFNLGDTIFDAEHHLQEGVTDLLTLLGALGVQLGAITDGDHRALVQLEEAGIRHHFSHVLCSDHDPQPKSTHALHELLGRLGADLQQVALVSHDQADMLLGKDAGVAKTIGVSHGIDDVRPLREAGADHVIPNIPAVLDVLE